MTDMFVWAEKYRPKTVADCILPKELKSNFQAMVDAKSVDSLLLYGGPGCGKTTVARAMLEELGLDYIIVNGSLDGNIDTLRTTIMQFASSISFSGGRKYVIIDEADYLTNAVQPALRNFMEEYSQNCGFILTANYPNRIMKEMKSRLAEVSFMMPEAEKPKLMAQLFKRVKNILDVEGVSYVDAAVAELVKLRFPDMRKVLIQLQAYSKTGRIDAGVIAGASDETIKELVGFLKKKDFTGMRKWVGEHAEIEFSDIMRKLYDMSYDIVKPSSIPQLVLIIADNQKTLPFAADKEIHTVGTLTEILVDVEFV